MRQPHLRHINAQHLIGDLRHCRFHALAVRVRANRQFQHAVGIEPCAALLVARHHRNAPAVIHAGAVRGLFAKNRKADADAAAVRFGGLLPGADFVETNRIARHLQHARVVAAVEMFFRDVVVRHLRRQHHVGEAHVEWLHFRFARNRVDHQFERKAHSRARHAAIRQNRRLIARHRPGLAAKPFHLVRARQDRADLRSFKTSRERIG